MKESTTWVFARALPGVTTCAASVSSAAAATAWTTKAGAGAGAGAGDGSRDGDRAGAAVVPWKPSGVGWAMRLPAWLCGVRWGSTGHPRTTWRQQPVRRGTAAVVGGAGTVAGTVAVAAAAARRHLGGGTTGGEHGGARTPPVLPDWSRRRAAAKLAAAHARPHPHQRPLRPSRSQTERDVTWASSHSLCRRQTGRLLRRWGCWLQQTQTQTQRQWVVRRLQTHARV